MLCDAGCPKSRATAKNLSDPALVMLMMLMMLVMLMMLMTLDHKFENIAKGGAGTQPPN